MRDFSKLKITVSLLHHACTSTNGSFVVVVHKYLFPTVYFIGKYIWSWTAKHFDWRLIRVNHSQGAIKLRLRHENGADTSDDGDSVAWDGGVSLMVGLNLLCDHTPTRRR